MKIPLQASWPGTLPQREVILYQNSKYSHVLVIASKAGADGRERSERADSGIKSSWTTGVPPFSSNDRSSPSFQMLHMANQNADLVKLLKKRQGREAEMSRKVSFSLISRFLGKRRSVWESSTFLKYYWSSWSGSVCPPHRWTASEARAICHQVFVDLRHGISIHCTILIFST